MREIPVAILLAVTFATGCIHGAADSGGSAAGDAGASACVPQTPEPDGGCDVFCQDCPSGYKCDAFLDRIFCALAGDVPTDGDCADQRCSPGNYCVNLTRVRQPPVDRCLRFCRNDRDCTNGGVCIWRIFNTTYRFCSLAVDHCDPLTTSGCPKGTWCWPIDNDHGVCIPPGSGGQGAPCQGNPYDCKAGFSCPNAKCIKFCRLGHDEDCASVTSSSKCIENLEFISLGLCSDN